MPSYTRCPHELSPSSCFYCKTMEYDATLTEQTSRILADEFTLGPIYKSVSQLSQEIGVSTNTVSKAFAMMNTHYPNKIVVRAGGAYQLTNQRSLLEPSALRSLKTGATYIATSARKFEVIASGVRGEERQRYLEMASTLAGIAEVALTATASTRTV